MPLDPAIRAAMRDSRTDFAVEDEDELDLDDDFGSEVAPADPSPRYAGLSGGETESFDDEDEDDDGEPAVKVKNPNLSNRLPREDFAPCVDFDDRPPLIERCQDVLKDRLKITRQGFILDGKIANTDKVVAAAGLLFKDQEPPRKSALPRQRKRKKKF